MTAATNKLPKLTLGLMVVMNTLVIIAFMTVNSIVCPDGLSGGECVKQLDNKVFLFQMITNLLLSAYYFTKVGKSKLGILVVNLVLTAIIYVVAATVHSISKAGVF